MRYWLMKTEPGTFGLEHLAAAPRSTSAWDGVRNFQARNMLRDEVRRGDEAFLYHSSCDSDPANPRWFMVDVQLKRRLARTIALEELRAHAGKELKGMVLLRPGNRLSITPVEAAHWKFILSLE